MTPDRHQAPGVHTDPGLQEARPRRINPIPFVPLPRAALADRRLTATDRDLLAALLAFAGNEADCWPSNRTLAQAIGCCERTVQLRLARLRDTDWARPRPDPDNPTGRRIVLRWRETPAAPAIPAQALAPSGVPGAQALAPSCVPEAQALAPDFREEDRERNITSVSIREESDRPHVAWAVAPEECPQRLLPPPQPPLDPPLPLPPPRPLQEWPLPLSLPQPPQGSPQDALSASESMTPMRPLQDELKALPGADSKRVRSVAWRLAHFLGDMGSIGFFLTVLAQVVAGAASVDRLLAAFAAGMKAKGRARKAGAVFAWAWKTWTPPPKPSQINRPPYYQATVPAVRASPSPGEDQTGEAPPSREEEIAELQSWLSQPRHPFANHARRRLAELGVAT
jgi:hypothetical protein